MDMLVLIRMQLFYVYCFFINFESVHLIDETVGSNTKYIERTTKYGQIKGFISERIPGQKVEQFLGVPYAAPPVGNLRLERPVEPTSWGDRIDTLEIPPACLQRQAQSQNTFEYIQEHAPDFNRESEDCLYLNLYKPAKPSVRPYPVLLFIHGGSNEVGMGAMFDGDILAGHSDLVVINFNYRLGALGFYGAANEELEGNYGFLDQIMVMKWVKNNVGYFNGDPDRVTIDGHSAGAADVGFHMVSPLAKGLFRYAIIQSGSPLAFWAVARKDWPEGYNIDERDIKKHHKKYLKTLDVKSIKEIKAKHNPASFISFPAIVDKHFLVERPIGTYRRGDVNGESFFMTFTKDEGSQHAVVLMDYYNLNGTFREHNFRNVVKIFSPVLFPKICRISVMNIGGFAVEINRRLDEIPGMDPKNRQRVQPLFNSIRKDFVFKALMRDLFKPLHQNVCGLGGLIEHEYGHWEHDPDDEHKPVKKYVEMESDFVFVAPMIKLADVMSRFTKNLYVMSFDHVSESAPGPEWLGVPHGRDLFYQFGVPLVGHKLYTYTEKDKEASRHLMKLIGRFVRYGNLSDGVTDHSSYSHNKKIFHRLRLKDGNIEVKEFKNYKPRKMAFWNKLLPQIRCPEKQCQTSTANGLIPQWNVYSFCFLLMYFAFIHNEILLIFNVQDLKSLL